MNNKAKITFIVVILIFLSTFFTNYILKLKEKIIFNDDKVLLIEKGMSETSFLKKINNENIFVSKLEWYLIRNIFNRKLNIRYGEYFFRKNTTLDSFQKILNSGKFHFRKFTLIEGTNSKNLLILLQNTEGLIGQIPNLKEGIYKPDTYNYKWGDTRSSLLQRMKISQIKILDDFWKKRKVGNVLRNKYEALILASIIEKESGKKEELDLISSVFVNRLKKNMKLQSDVTVAFALNIKGHKLKKNDLKKKNPFNTYINYGLPPSPISYPGKNAIKAALNPAVSKYLYFVSDGNGGHRFSTSYNNHKKNIRLWLKNNNQ